MRTFRRHVLAFASANQADPYINIHPMLLTLKLASWQVTTAHTRVLYSCRHVQLQLTTQR